jgi:hypothetical protein
MEQSGKETILHVVHSGVPDRKAEGIEKGWHDQTATAPFYILK